MLPLSDDFPHDVRERWKGLAQLVLFESTRVINGEKSCGSRYFITSKKTMTAEKALASVRGHWQVENKLHWVLDVAFREDESRLRAENAAENFTVIRHAALNLLRNVKGSKVGIKNRRLEAGWSEPFLLKVLSSGGS